MSEGSGVSSNSTGATCHACQEELKAGARKCRYCGSSQDWRRHLTFSSTVLALLVALVSVVSLSSPFVRQALQEDNSDITVSFAGLCNGYIVVIASNRGTRPATVMNGTLFSEGIFGAADFKPATGPHFVSEGTSARIPLELLNSRAQDKPLLSLRESINACDLRIDVLDFDSALRSHEIDLLNLESARPWPTPSGFTSLFGELFPIPPQNPCPAITNYLQSDS